MKSSAFRGFFASPIRLASAALVLTVSGCIEADDARLDSGPRPRPQVSDASPIAPTRTASATLTLDWTVDDSDDPRACSDYGSESLELIIYDREGSELATLTPYCDEFSASIDVPDGVYSLDATLVDRRGRAVTTTLAVDDIDAHAGEETVISVDFPVDSVL